MAVCVINSFEIVHVTYYNRKLLIKPSASLYLFKEKAVNKSLVIDISKMVDCGQPDLLGNVPHYQMKSPLFHQTVCVNEEPREFINPVVLFQFQVLNLL